MRYFLKIVPDMIFFPYFIEKSEIIRFRICNLGKNACRLFHFFTQFVFTTSETELDYYPQKVNARVASLVAERLKTEEIRKFKENP